jgi:hypothetical protein
MYKYHKFKINFFRFPTFFKMSLNENLFVSSINFNSRRRQRFINRRIQSIQRQRRRIINRTYRRRVFINNTSTFLLRIAQLQSFSDQLFNGSSFH